MAVDKKPDYDEAAVDAYVRKRDAPSLGQELVEALKEANRKLQQELEEARNSITYLNKENQEQHDAFTSELTAARSNLKAAEGEIEQWVASSQEQSKRYAAAQELLSECAEFVECVQPVLENRSAGFGGMALETFGAKLLQKLKEIK